MFCRKCGRELDTNEYVCENCGTKRFAENSSSNRQINDDGGFLWFLLGCCVPVAGLVLFFVWHDERPNTAKACIWGFGVSITVSIVMYIIYFFMLIAII